jgi:hypothetical protein
MTSSNAHQNGRPGIWITCVGESANRHAWALRPERTHPGVSNEISLERPGGEVEEVARVIRNVMLLDESWRRARGGLFSKAALDGYRKSHQGRNGADCQEWAQLSDARSTDR